MFGVIAIRDNGDEHWVADYPTYDEADRAADEHERFTGFVYHVRGPVND